MKKSSKMIVVGVIGLLIVLGIGVKLTLERDKDFSYLKFLVDSKVSIGVVKWQINHDETPKEYLNDLQKYTETYDSNMLYHSSNENKTIKALKDIIKLSKEFNNNEISKEVFAKKVDKEYKEIPIKVRQEIELLDKPSVTIQ